MSTKTTNLELIKLGLEDAADITAMNENWDKLDKSVLSDGSVPMTSDLHINKPEYPQVFLNEESTGSHARLQLHDGGLMIDSVPSSENPDTSHYMMLYGGGDLAGAIRLVDNQNGVKKWYSVYGEHNKPGTVVTTTCDGSGTNFTVPYPEGFNQNNCFIVSAMHKNSTGSEMWRTSDIAALDSDGIRIMPTTTTKNSQIKVLLEKYEG